ncbi:hypothetical protein XELAEV_18000192mg [Xenopus laevis]|uniref:Uncharacterized protein n=1 Tax=Xenopus laevis TaxID=8355 RepID=A0A974BQY1_XENLA|nr:hypothetical protein XELAEV_18000192mg [Xenopus laevis]
MTQLPLFSLSESPILNYSHINIIFTFCDFYDTHAVSRLIIASRPLTKPACDGRNFILALVRQGSAHSYRPLGTLDPRIVRGLSVGERVGDGRSAV